ncbi:hypothetical protein [Acidovorax sp. A1169]|nr:hypothetical protein [Acidovorax sp. A1169]MDP4073840.1 hypothetical protein [Acidovorax sp. A1169]
MPQSLQSSGQVPHSSGRNRVATGRTVAIIAVVVGFLPIAIMVPW